MAVFTTVLENDLRKFLMSYDIGDLVSYSGIQEGVENTNYLLETTKGKYILTLFESRTRASSLPFCFHFMEHLDRNGVSCPVVVEDVQGYETRMFCSRPTSIISFLEGQSIPLKNVTADHCAKMGAFLARMHNVSSNIEAYRENPIGFDEWNRLYCKVHSQLDDVSEGLSDTIIDLLVDIKERVPSSLPGGVIHGDLFPDNVFFKNDDVSAVIDFYFSCNESFLYDACICFNAWCGDVDDYTLDFEKAELFWKGYQEHRQLTSIEKKHFSLIRKSAALRILMTRLHDWIFPPEEQNVMLTPKNPDEYVVKLNWSDDDLIKFL